MARILKRVVLLLGTLALALAVYLYIQLGALTVEQLTEDTFVIRGLGGNVGVLRTSAGTVLVDTMTFRLQGKAINDRAVELTGQPVVLIINTHYHLDHTHGNPAFPPDVRVVSTARTLQHLKFFDSEFWEGSEHALPSETFDTNHTLQVGNKTIRLLRPGPGHTDGDLVALFVEDGVINLGDLLFQGHYPNIDLEAGGSVRAWSDTLDAVLALPFDRVVPGHGPTTNRSGITYFQKFMRQLTELGRQAANGGWTLEQTNNAAAGIVTSDTLFEPIKMIVPVGLDREFVIRRTWEEATEAVPPPQH